MSFSSIPILDLDLARSAETKPAFLSSLRHALLEVGFLYIKNTGIPPALTDAVIHEGKAFFDLPMDEKLKIEMKNAPSFLGYSRLGGEITAFKTDWREQIDLSTPHPLRTASQPLFYNLKAPNQWPDSLPSFRTTFEDYLQRMGDVSMEFTRLVAEALGLPPTAFDSFFEADQQHKLKVVKYPDLAALGVAGQSPAAQGVGPHKDSMLTSYVLQASDHNCLQVQNTAGEWIACKPVPGTLVVAIGQGLEALTQGVCQSTTHRVLSPERGSGPRFSIPFFQGVSFGATFDAIEMPSSVLQLKRQLVEQRGGRRDDVEFTFVKGRYTHLGEATFMNRIKSHPDVAEVWYPDLLRQIRADQEKESEKQKQKTKSENANDPIAPTNDDASQPRPVKAH
ncbi:MAG: hypothetical protein M1824_005436 [Vezdaea acicularis]|nr:MAG: hypothetical protein M1824_005436 [Vezdaea acicularis]